MSKFGRFFGFNSPERPEPAEEIKVKAEITPLEIGDEVSFKGNEGWYIADIRNNGELFELRRSRKDPKGRDILERDIARRSEVSLPAKKEI